MNLTFQAVRKFLKAKIQKGMLTANYLTKCLSFVKEIYTPCRQLERSTRYTKWPMDRRNRAYCYEGSIILVCKGSPFQMIKEILNDNMVFSKWNFEKQSQSSIMGNFIQASGMHEKCDRYIGQR